jgi:glycosyltransferase involved in cell wall biosynthesis
MMPSVANALAIHDPVIPNPETTKPSTEQLRLLFVSDHAYLPQRVGGTKSSTHDLCLSLAEWGHQVGVFCRLGGRDAVGLYHRVLNRLGRCAADHVLGYPVWRNHRIEAATLGAVASRFQPDAVVVQAEHPSPVIEAALATNLPTLVYLRDVELQKFASPPPRVAAVRYVANSAFTAQRYREAFGIAAEPIPPLIRPERFITTTSRQFVTFINPVPLKGSEIAFALAARRPDLPFLFVAGWPVTPAEEAARQARARRLPNITWQASVQDMRPVYARTRLLLAPSLWEEAWGRVVSEAQISGIPALASRRGGLPEAVGPGGMLVPHDAPVEEWAAALGAMLDDPARYAAVSAAALAHASRPDIQPLALLTQFEAVIAGHIATSRRAAAGSPADLTCADPVR